MHESAATYHREEKLTLLRVYEPVLKFHPDEKFFPIAVEDYFRDCRLFQARRFMPPIDLTSKWQAWGLKQDDALTSNEEARSLADMSQTLQYFPNNCFLMYLDPPSVRLFLAKEWPEFLLAILFAVLAVNFTPTNLLWVVIVVLYLSSLWFTQAVRSHQILKTGFVAYVLWVIGTGYPFVRYAIIPLLLWVVYQIYTAEKRIDESLREAEQSEKLPHPISTERWRKLTNTPADRVLVFIFLGFIFWDLNFLVLAPDTLLGMVSLNRMIAVGLFLYALPGLPGFLVDVTSKATGEQVAEARRRAVQIRRGRIREAAKRETKSEQGSFTYYGRIVEEDGWTILQYHYFYAYNSWRSAARGLNNHEADWEMIAVFLPTNEMSQFDPAAPPRPYGVAFSQHHDGAFQFWHTLETARNRLSQKRTHPVCYVALGSHANYPKEVAYRLTEMLKRQPLQWLFSLIIELPFAIFALSQELGLPVLYDILLFYKPATERALAKETRLSVVRERRKFLSLLPIDFALHTLAESKRVGVVLGPLTQAEVDAADEPVSPEQRLRQRYRHFYQFSPVLVEKEGWIAYPGLWGAKTLLKDESGPTGPMWSRKKGGTQAQRTRWQSPATWMAKLQQGLH